MLDAKVAATAFNKMSASHGWRQLCDPTLSFELPYYNDVVNLWRQKAAPDRIPARSHISARDLKPFLRYIAMAERIQENPSVYRWKLIGTKVAEVLGEHTGKLFEDSVAPEHLQRWNEVCDMVLSGTQPWRFYGEVTVSGRDYLIADNLYLPLADDDGTPRFVMALCRYTPSHMESDGILESIENAMISEPRGLL